MNRSIINFDSTLGGILYMYIIRLGILIFISIVPFLTISVFLRYSNSTASICLGLILTFCILFIFLKARKSNQNTGLSIKGSYINYSEFIFENSNYVKKLSQEGALKGITGETNDDVLSFDPYDP